MTLILPISSDSVKDLLRRLGLLSTASQQDLINYEESFSSDHPESQEMQETQTGNINNYDNNQEIQPIETVLEGDSVTKSSDENINVNNNEVDYSVMRDSSLNAKSVRLSESLNAVNSVTNRSSESEKAKNRNLSSNMNTKLKKTSPEESNPRKKFKLMVSPSINDVNSGGCSLSDIEDIGCCIKCKLDNGHGLMLQCKGCRQWWHYHCVGFEETDNLVPRLYLFMNGMILCWPKSVKAVF